MRLPISKVTRAKWTGSVAQPVECLLFKFEALSSNHNLIKKKKVAVLPTSLITNQSYTFKLLFRYE
jgi:hypothetical protein